VGTKLLNTQLGARSSKFGGHEREATVDELRQIMERNPSLPSKASKKVGDQQLRSI
jgi:hypothetical protein